jgi:hypothetical protein
VNARGLELADLYADRLGINSPDAVQSELAARFEHLSRFVLLGGMPRAGKAGAMSAEGAAAYGELWVLDAFLSDVRAALTGEGMQR